ncbi:uncharacterized protein LY89DRAFT_499801 [Mollisia scopiformis]|uniref:Uncharacterized protein n=1 Tax=Mollisia scopiformis TaxID=149040 RepID=A0A194XEM1_MOLSC|nr:uncharacterized protein LY89DRAFT_499801 [Mollisia scopiformis]KUJ18594.1 hypothetical protein LY89DRAFT_499801 [Mollisia scopiformis]
MMYSIYGTHQLSSILEDQPLELEGKVGFQLWKSPRYCTLFGTRLTTISFLAQLLYSMNKALHSISMVPMPGMRLDLQTRTISRLNQSWLISPFSQVSSLMSYRPCFKFTLIRLSQVCSISTTWGFRREHRLCASSDAFPGWLLQLIACSQESILSTVVHDEFRGVSHTSTGQEAKSLRRSLAVQPQCLTVLGNAWKRLVHSWWSASKACPLLSVVPQAGMGDIAVGDGPALFLETCLSECWAGGLDAPQR